MIWTQRLLTQLHAHPGPILIEGGEAYGAPFLIDALGHTQRLAWLQLTPTEASDAVAVGNRFADAVNKALEANFLPHALPFSYSIEVLKKRLPLLGKITIACINADYTPLFRDSLLELAGAGAKIILVTSATSATFDGLHLRQEELALTAEEAELLTGHFLSEDEKRTLWRSSGGAYLTFMNSVCRLRGLPLPHIPSPQGALAPPGEEVLVSPVVLLGVLQKLGRYVEALELAVMSVPERVAEIIGEAGPEYQEQGLLERLHLLLESLDDCYRGGEKVLEWRLVAGISQSDYSYLLPVIETYLRESEAPELRARYAGALPNLEESFAQAQRAAAAMTTPLTLYQLGRLHIDGKVGATILRQSVKLAETVGRPYEITRNAGALAESLAYLGGFEEAAHWSDWALQAFERKGVQDGTARLNLLYVYATAHIITGQTNGLREVLLEAKTAADSAELSTGTNIRTALANLELVLGNLEEAEELAFENLERSPRWRLGDATVPLVRILLERGKYDEALAKAQYAVTLTNGDDDFVTLPALLALGMVYAAKDPKAARSCLMKVLEAPDIEASFRIMAALHLLKIGALHFSELSATLQESLKTLSPTGFRLFSGSETEFRGVWNILTAQHTPLHIKVLGRAEVWFNDKRLELSGRALETLVLLALHPQGLTPEVLHSYLYDDEDTTLVALRSAVSRLRMLVPISAHPEPYRITVPFTFDAGDCETAVAGSDIRAALELYRGPLLEKSDAPGIREARLYLEERLRQSALQSGDAEALLPLAETLKDDLELWQATHAALATGDVRLSLVRAQLQRVTQELHPNYN